MAQLDLELDTELIAELELLAAKRGVDLDTLITNTIKECVQAYALAHALDQTNTTGAARDGRLSPN